MYTYTAPREINLLAFKMMLQPEHHVVEVQGAGLLWRSCIFTYILVCGCHIRFLHKKTRWSQSQNLSVRKNASLPTLTDGPKKKKFQTYPESTPLLVSLQLAS